MQEVTFCFPTLHSRACRRLLVTGEGKTTATQVVIQLKTFFIFYFFYLVKRSSGASQLTQLVLIREAVNEAAS